ncbi:PH domain-containing protein [Candidatus Thioglobus autotrophicus]|uniref:PH domain-containing protein n=1 Tax=Candidatus Thioglobus autotrophicus TaxID=1705394 RepID=UPI00299E4A73|nr:PH domain-containing protein [Candidatus Thioglobus autotrophicus]WPE16350.1 PH domain-containing protein [Candidatus Thioglobus autotrophicus]WPE17897.1 PH domain-containing protein [Candidatus Thioglobus autotrophicus]
MSKNVLYSNNPSMFKNAPVLFIVYVGLIAAFGIGIILLLIWYLQTKSTKLTITNKDILLEKGLLSKDRSEVSIKSIRTVKVKQSFFNRILGVGAIELYTAGDLPEIEVKGMPDPNKVRDIIKEMQG